MPKHKLTLRPQVGNHHTEFHLAQRTKRHRVILAAVAFVFLVAALYRYDLRPKIIRKDCTTRAAEALAKDRVELDEFRFAYDICLHNRGFAE